MKIAYAVYAILAVAFSVYYVRLIKAPRGTEIENVRLQAASLCVFAIVFFMLGRWLP